VRRCIAERLARLYPRAWRERFGVEFIDLLQAQPESLPVLLDVLRAAIAERVFNYSELETGVMSTYPANVLSLVRRPSGYLPMLMSIAAFALVVITVASIGATREPDEGAAAHVFQLLLAGQMPIVAFFAVKWFRYDWRAALGILTMQAAAIALAIAPVWYFGL
jgi:hypothetical protein